MKSPPHVRFSDEAVRSEKSAGYQFGDLTVDRGSRVVLRGRQALPIHGLSFDLLLALLQDAPNLVTPDELMKRVWPGVVVNPETISQRVKLLRHALGDDARAPRYVAVVRGRGYRAIATVTNSETSRTRRLRWPVLALSFAFVTLVLGFAAFYFEQSSLALLRKPSPAAEDFFLRAHHLHQSFRLDRIDKAIRYYERAIELDPRLALAYVGLADALILRRQVAELGPNDPARGRVTSLARTALEIDPRLGDAHAILARELASSFDLEGAARELALAESASPRGEYVLRYAAEFHGCCASSVAKAIEYAQRAAELDRLNAWTDTNVALAYWHAGRFGDALDQIDRVLEVDPQFWVAQKLRTVVLDDLGRFNEALAAARVAVELNDCSETRTELAIAYARMGDIDQARQIYDGLSTGTPGKYWSPTEGAMILLAMNDRASALSAVERAYRERDETLIEAIHTKRLAPLWEEPRFRHIVKSLGQERRIAMR